MIQMNVLQQIGSLVSLLAMTTPNLRQVGETGSIDGIPIQHQSRSLKTSHCS